MSIIRSLFASVALLTAVTAANAQISVYGTAMLTNFGLYNSSSPHISFKGDTVGFGGGAFYNFPIQSRLTAGIDARASYSPGTKGGTSAAASLRIGFVPHEVRLRPYFQIGGGFVSTDGYTFGMVGSQLYAYKNRTTNGAVEIVGGLDVRLTDQVDVRAIEYGAAASGTSSSTRAGVGFLSSGLVYHFHLRQHT
jgi:hypothetical protein